MELDQKTIDAIAEAIVKKGGPAFSDKEQKVLSAFASHTDVEKVEKLAKFGGTLVELDAVTGRIVIRGFLCVVGLVLAVFSVLVFLKSGIINFFKA